MQLYMHQLDSFNINTKKKICMHAGHLKKHGLEALLKSE